ncbi:MmcQ/YjbR family DNA-binding protein [Xylocopilactobacillus apis]|uniref:MmcQ/YjbR family DNA-binding protein n=1 Tax=Xylocopilactobacillus apis TaxID=2932183 RepID=A0AAU9DK02_9LACO|nr:MmcQ/YjbR family DNA-binding protein [Xylocopilactobacillus apis]BDR55774.1 hypothetical protein KIMC2_03360 [Xylocopilactobacillus apis]
MKREKLFKFIEQKYGVLPETLWEKHPSYCVFRHNRNRKWFGIVMNVKRSSLGISQTGSEDVLDIKLDPETVEIIQNLDGFMPAYHMNKTNWISIRIGKVDDDQIFKLVDKSYKLTK